MSASKESFCFACSPIAWPYAFVVCLMVYGGEWLDLWLDLFRWRMANALSRISGEPVRERQHGPSLFKLVWNFLQHC